MDDFKTQYSSHGKYIFWGAGLLLLTGSLFLFAQFLGEIKTYRFIGQEIEFRNTITVTGEGEVTAIPDVGEFSFAVVKEAKNVEEAQEALSGTMNGIIDALKNAGISEKDIKTINYNIVPKYEYRRRDILPITTGSDGVSGAAPAEMYYPPGPGEQVLVGYEVSHWILVKVRDVHDTGALLQTVGSMGGTNVSGINFTVDSEEAYLNDARKKAIDDAKEKASVLANDLGVRLVRVVSFSEYGGGPIYYRATLDAKAEGYGGGAPPEVPVGENTITSNVTIVYAIE